MMSAFKAIAPVVLALFALVLSPAAGIVHLKGGGKALVVEQASLEALVDEQVTQSSGYFYPDAKSEGWFVSQCTAKGKTVQSHVFHQCCCALGKNPTCVDKSRGPNAKWYAYANGDKPGFSKTYKCPVSPFLPNCYYCK